MVDLKLTPDNRYSYTQKNKYIQINMNTCMTLCFYITVIYIWILFRSGVTYLTEIYLQGIVWGALHNIPEMLLKSARKKWKYPQPLWTKYFLIKFQHFGSNRTLFIFAKWDEKTLKSRITDIIPVSKFPAGNWPLTS